MLHCLLIDPYILRYAEYEERRDTVDRMIREGIVIEWENR
jgi:hypothetical protein